MKALVLLRDAPPYRKDAFISGLKKCGYDIYTESLSRVTKDDVLLIWNRYGFNEQLASKFEKDGGTVLVAENGYLGREWLGGVWYAISRGHHNGAGEWYPGDGSRWKLYGVPLKPWKQKGSKVLVLGQRGIGEQAYRQPDKWAEETTKKLQLTTDKKVVLRPHPGNIIQDNLYQELDDVCAVVTWASTGALKALSIGVPVFYGMPKWIGAKAAVDVNRGIDEPFTGDRVPMFQSLAWAMWKLDEIEKGEPFGHLLRRSS